MLGVLGVMYGGHALAAEDKIGVKVGRPLKAAKDAMDKKEWTKALEKIQEADAVKSKSPYEQFQINEFKGYVLLQQGKYAEVAKIYEENLKSGQLPQEEIPNRLRALVQLNSVKSNQNWSKVVEFGDQWIKDGGTDLDTRTVVAQAHYLLNDPKGAISIMAPTIKSAEQEGKPIQENWLNILRNSQIKTNDVDGANQTLEKLVRLYPKSTYWDALLRTRMSQKNSDRVMMNLFRLADYVGVLDKPDQYAEMTEMLLEAGLPGEAKTVLLNHFWNWNRIRI